MNEILNNIQLDWSIFVNTYDRFLIKYVLNAFRYYFYVMSRSIRYPYFLLQSSSVVITFVPCQGTYEHDHMILLLYENFYM